METSSLSLDSHPAHSFVQIRACRPHTPANLDRLKSQIADILASGMLSNFGKYNSLLENRIRELLGVKFAFTVPNASTGLQILLSTLPKDSEVLVPSFTFPGTIHPIVHAGLRPKFVDVDENSFNIDPDSVRARFTDRTSAVLAVHAFGNPAPVSELADFAHEKGLRLFFDAACAMGSMYEREFVGGFGDAEVFSLSGTKIVTSGEGGVITTNDEQLAKDIRCLRNYGYCSDKSDCSHIGFNGKLDEMSAVLALWSLSALEDQIQKRKSLARKYMQKLTSVPGIKFQDPLENCEMNRAFFPIEIDPTRFGLNATELCAHLRRAGIETKRYFSPPMHRTSAYESFNGILLPVSERLSNNLLCLPLHTNMAKGDVARVCEAVERAASRPQVFVSAARDFAPTIESALAQ